MFETLTLVSGPAPICSVKLKHDTGNVVGQAADARYEEVEKAIDAAKSALFIKC